VAFPAAGQTADERSDTCATADEVCGASWKVRAEQEN